MSVEFGPGGCISLSQGQYIVNLLKRYGMDDCKPIGSPGMENTKLSKADCPELGSEEHGQMQELDYRGLVGSLNYLSTTTRPDIAYASHLLSSFLQNPGILHWKAAKHVLRYLQGTRDHQMTFRHDPDGIRLTGYTDADYGGNIDSRKSTSGYCFNLQSNSAIVSWRSKLQSTVALSTTEAEVTAATAGVQELVHLHGLLEDMGFPQTLPLPLMVDNQACIALSKNPIQQGKTKHFAIKLEYLRDLSNNKFVVLNYLQTDHMPADILTKFLGRLKTAKFYDIVRGQTVTP